VNNNLVTVRQMAVYDGQRLLGHIVERGGRLAAAAASGRKLGAFAILKSAADALSDADDETGERNCLPENAGAP